MPLIADTRGITEAPLAIEPLVLIARVDGRDVARVRVDSAVSIGSAPENDLVLAHETVSRTHARVEIVAGGVHVRDLGSRNGVRYQGARVSEARVPAWGVLLLGRAEIRVEPANRPPTACLADLESRAPAMMRVLECLAQAARAPVTILLEGESGTGKERLARAVHAASPRAEQRFEVIDCGALAKGTAASELFGHVTGAFTGAVKDYAGAFERAGGGTVFLDEIGELPLDLQTLLLRAIESREIRRVGDSGFRPVDVRIVAATNRNLDADARGGRFRADLLHRLSVVRARVPALRERIDDLPDLVRVILASLGASGFAVSPETLASLAAHDWPGNVRELRNAIERALTLSPDRPLGDALGLPPATKSDTGYRQAKKQALDAFEAEYVRHVLRLHDGNVSDAARAAGIDRVYLHRLMRRHGVKSGVTSG